MKITDALLKQLAPQTTTMLGLLKLLGKKQSGGMHSHYSRRLIKAGIDTSHFKGYAINRGRPSEKRKTAKDILVLRQEGERQKAHRLVRSLLEIGRNHVCSCCGTGTLWNNRPIVLEVDHMNENWLDDRQENLRFVCPNCHSQITKLGG